LAALVEVKEEEIGTAVAVSDIADGTGTDPASLAMEKTPRGALG